MQIQVSERRLFWWLLIVMAGVMTWNIFTAAMG
jgi:hypothetical protein